MAKIIKSACFCERINKFKYELCKYSGIFLSYFNIIYYRNLGNERRGENSTMGLSNIKSCNVEDIDTDSDNNDLFVSCHSESVYLAIKEKKLADMEISAAEAAEKVSRINDNPNSDKEIRYSSDLSEKIRFDNVTERLPETYDNIKKMHIRRRPQSREVKINMSLYKLVEMYDRQIKFLLFSLSFVIMSLVGIILYYRSGYYIIHPTIYLLTLLMGLGWTCTAIGSILNNKGVKACIKKG